MTNPNNPHEQAPSQMYVDRVKETLAKAITAIEIATDYIGADTDAYEDELTMLDQVRDELRNLANQAPCGPGIYYDGTPVRIHVRISEGAYAHYYPRLDGPYSEWFERISEGATR